jgi:hypothetical protein
MFWKLQPQYNPLVRSRPQPMDAVMKQQKTIREPLRQLPSERSKRVYLSVSSGDATLIIRCLHLIAERCERTSSQLHGLAPELRARAARLRNIATTVDDAVGGGQ